MKFSELASFLERLEKETSRNEITKILASVFKKSGEDEIDKVVNLCLGGLAPAYKGVVFNMADRMMLQVIAKAFKKDASLVKSLYKEKGDLGDVAESLAKGRGKGLSVPLVYERLEKVASEEGEGSQERKIGKMAQLLGDLDAKGAKYVARIPVGRLRLGFSDKTIIDALSWMRRGDKSAKEELERAYHVAPDVGLLAKNVKKKGIKKVTKAPKPIVGVPVLPMLAQRLKSPAEMIAKMEKVAVEPKFDGLRIQIHFKKGSGGFIKAYTRNLNETSWMFPELAKIDKFIRAKDVILDSEAVGVDEERRKLANFQATMTRRRKHEIGKMALKIPIKFYVFDILLKNGKNLMDKPYVDRRRALDEVVKSGRLLQKVNYKITRDPKEIEKEMSSELSVGMEGIMVKKAGSRYIPGRTGWRWVKMKESEKEKGKLVDTLDCIVMGYSAGRGKRVTFGVGQFLVGIKNRGKIKTVTKIGTGLTDEQFKELKQKLAKLEVADKPKNYEVNKNLEPDFWVEPKLVVEIAADEITKSPTHSSGYALRFPRLVRFRDDKNPSQATGLSEIKKLFKLQKS